MMSLEARVDALTRDVVEETRLMAAQLTKAAAARRAAAPLPPISGGERPTHVEPLQQSSSPNAIAPSTLRARTDGTSASSPSPTVAVAPLTSAHKEGTLLHLVRSGGLFGAGGSQVFVPHYVVVTGNNGISWYASRADFLHQPQRPLGHAAFWIETYNSRGSRFKKAAVCWPLLLPEDCPAATDPSKTYFAVDYYTTNGGREQLVLAADSPEERDAWVQLLTMYIDLYLAPRAESEELQHITRGAAVPMHRSGVIEGEAPGGTIL